MCDLCMFDYSSASDGMVYVNRTQVCNLAFGVFWWKSTCHTPTPPLYNPPSRMPSTLCGSLAVCYVSWYFGLSCGGIQWQFHLIYCPPVLRFSLGRSARVVLTEVDLLRCRTAIGVFGFICISLIRICLVWIVRHQYIYIGCKRVDVDTATQTRGTVVRPLSTANLARTLWFLPFHRSKIYWTLNSLLAVDWRIRQFCNFWKLTKRWDALFVMLCDRNDLKWILYECCGFSARSISNGKYPRWN